MKKEYEMAINTMSRVTQSIPIIDPGLGEEIKSFFLSIAEWVDTLVTSPKSLDLYDKGDRQHLSVKERTEIEGCFMGL